MTQNKELLKARFAANLENYAESAVVQKEICAYLAGKIAGHVPSPRTAVEIGAGTGFLTRHLFGMFPDSVWMVNDLIERSGEFISRIPSEVRYSCLYGDAENIILPKGTDLVASASTLQWLDDQPAFIRKVYDCLNEGGHFCFSTFGPENFREVKACSGVGLRYYSIEELTALLLEPGFNIIDSEDRMNVLEFDSAADVLRHIRTTGVNSIENVRWTRKDLMDFGEKYNSRFRTPAGRLTLTYHPLFVLAKK